MDVGHTRPYTNSIESLSNVQYTGWIIYLAVMAKCRSVVIHRNRRRTAEGRAIVSRAAYALRRLYPSPHPQTAEQRSPAATNTSHWSGSGPESGVWSLEPGWAGALEPQLQTPGESTGERGQLTPAASSQQRPGPGTALAADPGEGGLAAATAVHRTPRSNFRHIGSKFGN